MNLLFLDIETFPALVYVWGVFKENVGVEQIVKPPRIACFAAQWQGAKQIQFFSEWQHGRKGMLKAAQRLLSEADAVCHYFGSHFDIPWLNGEFMVERMRRTPPIPEIDLKDVVARKAHFISNKLAHVAPLLKIGAKMKHEGFELWRSCMDGDKAAQKHMEEYNKQDTALMEPLYRALLPWIDRHPNQGHWNQGVVCPKCGSADLKSNGWRITEAFKYRRICCADCGSWMREVMHYKAPGSSTAQRTKLRAL